MLPAARSASRSSSERSRKSRSASSASRSRHARLVAVRCSAPARDERPRRRAVAGERGCAAPAPQREHDARRAPSTSTTTGSPHTTTPMPRVRGRQQDLLAVARRRTRRGSRASLSPAAMRSHDVGADRARLAARCCRRPTRRRTPGTRARRSSRSARAVGRVARLRAGHEHDDARSRRRPRARATAATARRAQAQRPRLDGAQHRLELVDRSPARTARRTTATPSATITYVSGWPVVPKPSAGLAVRVERDRPADRLVLATYVADRRRARRRGRCRASRSRGRPACAVVERLERGRLLVARDAPRVPEVHDVRSCPRRSTRELIGVAVERRRGLNAGTGSCSDEPAVGDRSGRCADCTASTTPNATTHDRRRRARSSATRALVRSRRDASASSRLVGAIGSASGRRRAGAGASAIERERRCRAP